MNRRWGILAALTAAMVLASMMGTYQANADAPDYVYINADEGSPEVQAFLTRGDVHYRRGHKGGFSAKVEGSAKSELHKLGVTVSDIAVYHPNGVPSDPTPYGIEQIYSDPGITQTSGGSGITIGHLDTGIERNHPDLVGRVVGCKDATSTLALGDPANNTCTDFDGHGTHTAGSAVADGGSSGTGIWGVAPEAKLYSITVCDSSGCFGDDMAAAIDYLGNNNLVDIINISIGGSAADSRIVAAIDRHKDSILFVASAGNNGPSATIEYPAWDPNVIAVAAIDSSETVPNFSSRGIDDGDDSVITIGEIELAAAGSGVESTFPSYLPGGLEYEYYSGTSMAAPQVAGLAAKLWQGDPASTRAHLRTTTTDIVNGKRAGTGYDVASGYGLPHVGASAPPPPPPPPAAVLTSIDVSPTSKSIEKGKSQQYIAVGNYDDGSSADITSGASWNSSDATVASVNSTGLATGVEVGAALISANMDGIQSNDATLNVTPPPPVVTDVLHVGDIDGYAKVNRRGKWQAFVIVTVHDSSEDSVRRAKVHATWTTSDGTDTATCRVRRSGACKFRSPRYSSNVSGVTFDVVDISHDSLTYDASSNHDSDGDSNGTTLGVAAATSSGDDDDDDDREDRRRRR